MLGRLWNLLPLETLRGYEHPELVNTVFQKTIAYQASAPWPEMVGVSSVLDFGGACGRHYKDARQHSLAIRWAVVETPAMVARAKELETHQLKFFTDIDAAAIWLGDIEVIHSNGAVQYTPDPLAIVRKLAGLGAGRMLWYRLFLGSGTETQISRLQDNGPGKIGANKKVAYDFTRISREDFIAAHNAYIVEANGDDWFKFALSS
jgi:putative methyltransferase (TIGR04325 family)